MTDPMTPERLAEIEARANSATEGPWWLAHPGLIYGKYPHHEGYAQAVTKADPPDAEFIAHARTDIPALLAEVRRLKSRVYSADLHTRAAESEAKELRVAWHDFTERLGFGDGITEPAAALEELVEPIEEAFGAARDHFECPVVCELCGEPLASQTCAKCQGVGCLPTPALAYLECDECAGAGMIHPDCAEQTYTELAAEVRRLQAAVERVREMHVPFRIYGECECEDTTTPGHVDVEEVGTTCNLLYTACRECCTSGAVYRYQTEDCDAGHDHRDTYCPTIAALDRDTP